MLRVLCLLLVIALLMPCASLGEGATLLPYHSDFSAGDDGWYPRSAGGATGYVQDGAYWITGRTASWNSPGHAFALTAGKEHHISVDVYHEEAGAVTFILSVEKVVSGLTSYENLVTAEVPGGVWTTLSCDYTPAACDSYVLYVETKGSGTVSYAIRDFDVYQKSARYDFSLPSLKRVWGDAFDFGTAVTMMEAINTERMDFYASQFNIFTPGNELKPDSVLDVAACRRLAKEDDTAVAVHFDSARPMLDYCAAHGLKVHGHVLVWHSQTPEAFFHEGYDTARPLVSREVMLARLENYIRLVLTGLEEAYPGLIVSWDVVNEAVADGSAELRESLWTQVVGQDFVNRAFEYARRWAPEGTILCYNDYNTYYEPKLTGICRLVDSLLADGTIDCYGFQMHMQAEEPTVDMLRNCVETIASRGLLLRISELDVCIDDTGRRSLALQAQRYADVLAIAEEYADQLIAVHTWGVSDHLSWRRERSPLLFDTQDQPKLAFWALIDPSTIPAACEEGPVWGPATEDTLASLPVVRGENFGFQALLTGEGTLLVRVSVKDGPKSPEDAVTIFVGDSQYTINRADEGVEPVAGGYVCTFRVENAPVKEGAIAFDLMVNNKGALAGWSDTGSAGADRAMGILTVTEPGK